jgi:hypothetical protein
MVSMRLKSMVSPTAEAACFTWAWRMVTASALPALAIEIGEGLTFHGQLRQQLHPMPHRGDLHVRIATAKLRACSNWRLPIRHQGQMKSKNTSMDKRRLTTSPLTRLH